MLRPARQLWENLKTTLGQFWDNFDLSLKQLWDNSNLNCIYAATCKAPLLTRAPIWTGTVTLFKHHRYHPKRHYHCIFSTSSLSSSMALLPTTLTSPSKSPTSKKSQILLALLHQNPHQHWHRNKCNNDDKYYNYHKYDIHHKYENRHKYNNHHRHISISLLGATFSACKLVHITASSSRPACSSSEVGL